MLSNSYSEQAQYASTPIFTYISGKWALTILDNGNTRDVPEDAYTLARDPKYVQLGDTIDRLETSKTVETTVGAQVYSQTGLAVYIAWKWADYVFSWKGSELRAVDEDSRAASA